MTKGLVPELFASSLGTARPAAPNPKNNILKEAHITQSARMRQSVDHWIRDKSPSRRPVKVIQSTSNPVYF